MKLTSSPLSAQHVRIDLIRISSAGILVSIGGLLLRQDYYKNIFESVDFMNRKYVFSQVKRLNGSEVFQPFAYADHENICHFSNTSGNVNKNSKILIVCQKLLTPSNSQITTLLIRLKGNEIEKKFTLTSDIQLGRFFLKYEPKNASFILHLSYFCIQFFYLIAFFRQARFYLSCHLCFQ